ncbi:MAG: CoA transferase [Pseudomonadota bacterium]|nr:CoA transferase [Pseudomonadota bacterium]
MSDKQLAGPLSGIKVLDLTHALAGPFATQLLADLGADVVKVENPNHQDFSRSIPPFVGDHSHYFVAINHGKRSIGVDFRSDAGRETLLALAAKADVLIENFRPGVVAKMGLEHKRLAEINPRLIQCSISGFGQEGSSSGRPAYDIIIQAMSGFMSVTGEIAGAPLRCGVSLGDLVAGMYAVQSICVALFERERTGRGKALDVPMFDCLVSLMSYYITLAQVSGVAPRATGSAHATIVPLGSFRTADGWLAIAVTTNTFWTNLCRGIGHQELASDARFAELADRQRNRAELTRILDGIFLTRSNGDWSAILNRADVPNAPVLNISELLSSDIVAERNLFRPVATAGGEVLINRYPVLDRGLENLPLPPDHIPHLGADSSRVLRDWLGDPQELSA